MIGERSDPIAELFAPARACEPTAREIARASAVVAECVPGRGRGLRVFVAVWTALVMFAAAAASVALEPGGAGRDARRTHASPGAAAITAPLSFAAAAALEQTLRSARRHGNGVQATSSTGTRLHGARDRGVRGQIGTRSTRRGACARAPGRLVAARCSARAAPVAAAHPA
jgi:hypothetical protein